MSITSLLTVVALNESFKGEAAALKMNWGAGILPQESLSLVIKVAQK